MAQYEYKVIPAPAKGEKAQGVKAPEARMANTVQNLLNVQASHGWEYMRTDILPSEERHGLTSTQTVYRTLMVFRRQRGADNADKVILTAQSIAETVTPGSGERSGRREPSLAPVQPLRADPAKPETPLVAPKPQTPEQPDPKGPKTD